MVTTPAYRTNGTSSDPIDWVPGFGPEDERPKPELDWIMDTYREGKEYFAGFHANCKEEDEYYLGNRTIPMPPDMGLDPIQPATAAALINVATDHVDVNNLQIDVPSSARSRARAERLKKFYVGAWLANKAPTLRTAVKQAFLYDTAFLKDMFDADLWPNAPQEANFDNEADYKDALKEFMDDRCIKWPLRTEVVNPKNLIWDDSKTGMKWAIEFYEVSGAHLSRRYPEWASGRDPKRKYQWLAYWDDVYAAYICDGEFVWGPEKHGYGFMPFTQILPAHSYTFEDGPPHERYRGLLNPVHSLLDEEARLMAQIEAVIRTVAWRTLDFSGPQAQVEKTMESYDLFGGKNWVAPGVEVELSPLAQVPPDLFRQLDLVQTKIEEATFPNVVRGVRPKGVSTGFGISVLAGMGRLVFQGVADGVRHGVEQSNSKKAQLVENKVKGKLTVHARSDIHQFDQTIGPDDINGYYENAVQIKAEAPEEREREALLALRLHSANVISLYEAQRRSGITNPLEEQMQIRAEILLNSPEFLAVQVQQLLQQIDPLGQLAASVAQGGQSPSSGNPGSQNIGGAQLQRPGERNIQQGRVASQQGNPSVFPQGAGGLDALGAILGGPTGGPQGVPSGQRIGG